MPWSALAQVGGSLASSALGYYYDRQLMAKQFDYQKQVLQNQNQWRVADLKAAGLNPILATGISSAASSGVSIPSGKAPNLDPVGAMATAKNMKLVSQQTQTEKQRTATEAQNTQYVTAQAIKVREEARLISEQVISQRLQNQLNALNLPPAEKEAKLREAIATFDLEWDELWKITKFANSAESVVDAVPIGKFASQFVDYILGKGRKPSLLSTVKTRTGKKGFTETTRYTYGESH